MGQLKKGTCTMVTDTSIPQDNSWALATPAGSKGPGHREQLKGAVVLLIIRFKAINRVLYWLKTQRAFWKSAQTSSFPGIRPSARISLLWSLPIISGTRGITIILSTHFIHSSAVFILHCQQLLFRHHPKHIKLQDLINLQEQLRSLVRKCLCLTCCRNTSAAV